MPSDRAARLQSGVRAGAAGARAGDVLAPEQAARRCRRGWPPTCSSTAARRPQLAARIADASSPTAAPAGRGDRRTAALVARELRGAAASGRRRAPALQARRASARERDRPARRALAAPDRDRRRARRRGRARRARQRRRHRGAARAGARLRRAGRRARRSCSPRWTARRSARWAPAADRRARRPPSFVDAVLVISDLGSRTPSGPLGAGLVERLAPRGHRPAAHGRGVDPPGARRARGGGAGVARPARAAVVPDRHRAAGPAARRTATTPCASRAAASCPRRATARSRRSTRTGWARSAAPRCARSPRSTRAGGPSTGPELRDSP